MQTKTEAPATAQNGESVQTDAAPAQPQSRTTPDRTTAETASAAVGAESTAPIFGAVIQGLDHVGEKVHAQLVAIAPDFDKQLEKLENADDSQLKKQLDEYKEEDHKLGEGMTAIMKKRRQLFRENIGLFWTIHECIVSPGFRSDLNGGKERTADYNFKMWGASTWQEFVERHSPYGLDATDKYVKDFGREYDRSLKDGAPAETGPVADVKGEEAGTGKSPKTPRSKVAEETDLKLAAEFKSMCNLALNSNATDEQLAATLKSKAEETYKALTPAEAKSVQMPKIREPRQSEVEKLGIELARLVWTSANLAASSKEKEAANQLLVKAGLAATIMPAPSAAAIDSRNGQAINDREAESVMMCVAQGKSVDPEKLAKYEDWLAVKGDTERANSLRRELRDWKDARDKKSLGPLLTEAAPPAAKDAANARSDDQPPEPLLAGPEPTAETFNEADARFVALRLSKNLPVKAAVLAIYDAWKTNQPLVVANQ